MIQIILFVIAVILWDKFKKSMRPEKKPTVSLRIPEFAACGCEVFRNEVVKICAAHSAMCSEGTNE